MLPQLTDRMPFDHQNAAEYIMLAITSKLAARLGAPVQIPSTGHLQRQALHLCHTPGTDRADFCPI